MDVDITGQEKSGRARNGGRRDSGERCQAPVDAGAKSVDGGGVGAVVGERAAPLDRDQPGPAKATQVVRDRWLLDGQRAFEIADAHRFAFSTEEGEELQPDRVREELELGGREVSVARGHGAKSAPCAAPDPLLRVGVATPGHARWMERECRVLRRGSCSEGEAEHEWTSKAVGATWSGIYIEARRYASHPPTSVWEPPHLVAHLDVRTGAPQISGTLPSERATLAGHRC